MATTYKRKAPTPEISESLRRLNQAITLDIRHTAKEEAQRVERKAKIEALRKTYEEDLAAEDAK